MEFCGLSHEEAVEFCLQNGLPRYVANQIFDWVYQKKTTNFSSMSNLSKQAREVFSQKMRFPSIRLLRTLDTEEAIKFLWELEDGHKVESVLLFSFARRTLCISSQVGCNAKCAFCASGQAGWIRHLTKAEILEQVLLVEEFLAQRAEKLTHLVFMGMGEPLENFSNLVFCLKQLSCPKVFGFSPRRITVSTVGIVDKIYALASCGVRVNLVLSLHAPNQHIRKKIIPYARKYPLEDILTAMQVYSSTTKRDVTYEYILIEEVNAEKEHAEALAELLKEQQCTVNLIPYNPVPRVRLTRPSVARIMAFENQLRKKRIPVTRRYTKGTEIAAACGQLAFQPKQSSLAVVRNS